MKYLGLQKRMVPSTQVSSLTTGVITSPSAKTNFAETTLPVTANLNRWYDASDLSSMTISNGNISQWNDKSGNGIHVSQGTGSRQPNILLNYVNGRHAVSFSDSTEDNLSSGNQPTSGSSSATIFFVGKSDMYTSDQTAVSWGTSNAVGAGISLVFTGQNNSVRPNTFAWGYAGSLDGNYIYSQSSHADKLVVLSSTFSGTSLTQQVYAERIGNDNPDNKTAAGSNVGANSEFFLGWLTNPWYATFGYNGIICEVIVYTGVMGSTDRTTMMNYLKKKWGLE
jgi:hypothetical protein